MDLLLEIGTEEIPAKFMPDALSQLGNIAETKFNELNILYGQVQTVGTSRRLTLIIRGIAKRQTDRQIQAKGPSLKIAFDSKQNPTKAALGFAKGQGVDAKDLIIKDGYVYAIRKETGKDVRELLPSLLPDIINSLSFPKTMRWGDFDFKFVRPIRCVTALFDGMVVPFAVAGVDSADVTFGHRFLGHKEIRVESVEGYFNKLKENYVIADQNLRRETIRKQVIELADSQGGVADIDDELLEEITFLLEYPTALFGRFDEKYLKLPPEAIITPMREHQRYFPVKNKDGKLLPAFITVRCGNSEHLDTVRHGNERVLKARLSDAKFFFEEDRKLPLEDRVDMLKSIVFQEGLGSVYDKTLRLIELSERIGKIIGDEGIDFSCLKRSAYLSKADLVTGMVGEFAELQGVMGREYALLDGEKPQVAQAVFEHYLPRFSGDVLPESCSGRILGIADKMDNIIAAFSRGLMPTGSQDPYALRRQALGIVNIIIDANYNINIKKLAEASLDLFKITDAQKRQTLIALVLDFFRLRLKNVLTEEKIRYDIIDAVLAAGIDDVFASYLKARALAQALEGDSAELFKKTIQAIVRAANLLKHSEMVELNTAEAFSAALKINESLFESEAETLLYQAYNRASETKFCDNLSSGSIDNYKDALNNLASLTEPINAFFDAVMVMVPDESLKRNRLAMLGAIVAFSLKIADFNKIVI